MMTSVVKPSYDHVLHQLREASPGMWPATSAAHARVIDAWGVPGATHGEAMTLGRPLRGTRPPLGNKRFPQLAEAIFALERQLNAHEPPHSSCLVTRQAVFQPHLAPGRCAPGRPSSMLTVGLGDFRGGELVVEGDVLPIRYSPQRFDGWSRLSWTRDFEGERFALQFFTSARESLEAMAETVVAAQRPRFQYRKRTTDVNVVCEVLGSRPAYAGPPSSDPRWADAEWSPAGHVVLDGGAHIGAFSAWALGEGARAVRALEPEPSNVALLRINLADYSARGLAHVEQLALAAGPPAEAWLWLGKERSDGVGNTWRHALEGWCHYKGSGSNKAETDGGGSAGGGGSAPAAPALDRVRVPTRPLFGTDGVLTDDITYVKLDIEGAEVALLSEYPRGAWRRVRRLAFEWSFTKQRELGAFARAVALLEREGFTVTYEGKGSWERLERWPWHMDAIVFAARAEEDAEHARGPRV